MKIINQNKNHILEEIKNELQDSEKETLDYYKEYFIKFKNLTLTKLKSVHLALEEVSNERDEYKDIMEAMILVDFIILDSILIYNYFQRKMKKKKMILFLSKRKLMNNMKMKYELKMIL